MTARRVELTTSERWRIHAAVELTVSDPSKNPPDVYLSAVESIATAHVAEALREAATYPAAMRVNTDGNASGREWLTSLADEYEGGDR